MKRENRLKTHMRRRIERVCDTNLKSLRFSIRHSHTTSTGPPPSSTPSPLIHFSSFRPSPTLSNTQSHIASPKLFLPSSHGEINNNLIFLTCGGCQIARGMVEQAQGEGQRPARHPAPAKLRPCRSCRRRVFDDNVRRL